MNETTTTKDLPEIDDRVRTTRGVSLRYRGRDLFVYAGTVGRVRAIWHSAAVEVEIPASGSAGEVVEVVVLHPRDLELAPSSSLEDRANLANAIGFLETITNEAGLAEVVAPELRRLRDVLARVDAGEI